MNIKNLTNKELLVEFAHVVNSDKVTKRGLRTIKELAKRLSIKDNELEELYKIFEYDCLANKSKETL